MDAVAEGLKRQPPWAVLYADDVVLMAENRKELEEEAQRWKDQLGTYGLKLNTKNTEYMEEVASLAKEVFKMKYLLGQTHPGLDGGPSKEFYATSECQCNSNPKYTVL
ncbi:unnamed protein product [Strongylus vulgaris]|uniref:Reverse transcriptase domain-containing protein n=1 Tax=Strongylus vulgaris TaxID=40348 RepID=A0A3P7L0J1_STRVU|nr:unnamed protein product [Strongylus vulgaris]